MKANEAPEKLYIDFRDKAESTWRCAYTEKALANDIEYIKKDAFIEKVADYIANNMRCDGYTFQTKAKFIRDFKKYMEGE